MSITFLLAALVVAATPGTGVVYTLSAGLAGGRRSGLVAAVACTLSLLPHLLAAVTGLAGLVAASTPVFRVLTWAGVAYLLWTGWTTLRDRDPLPVAAQPPPGPARLLRDGVLVNLLNPKVTVFFVAFLPQFVPPGAPAAPRMLACGGVFVLVTLVVFGAYGLLAGAVRHRVLTRPRLTTLLRRGLAGSFLALGVSLALTAR
ncbi:LysE family translocator [Micromonospora sp. R77]|uniref:LysE family translocator n=1 Tax=Micromonospora sp. R77 TaxID=2925836 RepID=UPI001F60D97D|nr:LysE family translocator [Micromonospora sp. R77]MCI4066533.1 LysE family translocator [Micromonospora sp. R77]